MDRRFRQPGDRALRKGRFSQPGRQFVVTTVCDARQRRFECWETAAAVAAKLHEVALWRDARCRCWVLMPDPLHLLIELGDTEASSALIRRANCTTASAANAADGREGRLWMSGFHDHALRCDENAIAVARDPVANPIRAGLADCVGDDPF